MQFHIVMEVEFPETYQHVLDYLNWLKGDIITYFNVKCWAPLDLYSEFVIAMVIIPGALSIGIIGAAIQRYRNQRRLDQAAAPKQDSQDSVPDSGLSERLSESTLEEKSTSKTKPVRTGQSDWESLLNKMFILTFLVC